MIMIVRIIIQESLKVKNYINYTLTLENLSNSYAKNSFTPKWKGRVLERTRFHSKIETKTHIIIDNTDEDNDDEEVDCDDAEFLYSHINDNDCCKERLKIGRNLLRNKDRSETQVTEFKNKVSKLLNDVYSLYLNSNRNQKSIVHKENEFKLLYQQINDKIINSKEYLILFARILQENISEYIKYSKNLIIEKMPIKTLKENYYDMKKAIHADLGKDKNAPQKQRESKYVKCINEIYQFCKENRKIIVFIVKELTKIYTVLIQACPLLENIFRVPLGELEANYEISIKMENLHKEEFLDVIINDDFIKCLLNEINNKEIAEFIEQRPTISNIEEEIKSSSKDMKKLKDLIEKIDNQKELIETINLARLSDAKSVHDILIKQSK
jgi:hypothetical protein